MSGFWKCVLYAAALALLAHPLGPAIPGPFDPEKRLFRSRKWEQNGRIYCLRPQEPITISRFEGNVDTLTELYARGHREGRQALAGLQAYLAGPALQG